MNITVYLGASIGTDEVYQYETKELGKWIGENSHCLIYGGSRVGLMGVLADACLKAGGEVIGVEPGFFLEDELQHEGITQLIVTETMAERRAKMIEMGDAFIAFPGGTGTLEEISEVISLNKLGQLNKPVVILNIEDYYSPLQIMFKNMVEEGFLDQKEFDRIHFSRSVEDAGWWVEHSAEEFGNMYY